ncbi:hypothetical protein A2U01_0072797 [Trifolium medium]|uniref:Uncharacterized protein n=1 Tax=Trifolium medium TaxID=97028 RepID=A0A392SRS2_9FABA|nr:hypothetical protein [Trifolium medium]
MMQVLARVAQHRTTRSGSGALRSFGRACCAVQGNGFWPWRVAQPKS